MKTRISKITNLCLSLALCLGFVACNQEDFYKNELLEKPIQDPTTTGEVESGQEGGDPGSVGGTQGGVDGGVNGGTTGSTTGSSTTSGSTDGSVTSGSTDGSTTSGSTTGSTTSGSTDGSTTSGSTDGSTTSGSTTGSTTSGSTTGSTTSGSTTGSTTSGSTTGSTTGGVEDCNNGHGNDDDGVDESNPSNNGGGSSGSKCKVEKFNQSSKETKKLDILWVIDNSGSMNDEQASLGTNFSYFIDDFIKKDVDFKMAVTTTDVSSYDKKGKMVFGSNILLTSSKAKANESKFKEDFKELVDVGVGGSGQEKGLEGAEGFLSKHAASFLRQDAYLAIVVLSDEEDQSPKEVSFYTDYFKSFKASAGLVKVYSIVDVSLSNKNTRGSTFGYQRYSDASKNTAGIVKDIRNDFYTTLSAMGDSLINLLDSFALGHDPVPGSLKVYVNGVETKNYSFDESSRSIKFDSDSIPAVGAEIEVAYVKK